MAEVLGSAVLELSTDDTKLQRGLTGAETSANKGLTNLKKVALGVGAVGVTAAAGFAATMLKTGAEVESAFAEVRTLLPGIGDEAFGALQADVLAFSKETGNATDVTIPALYQAISAGVPANNVVDFLQVASAAAVGGVTDLETAVDGITSVTNAYGTEVLSAQKASDLMFTAVRLGKTDFEQLSKRLFNVAPLAASLGVGFDEVAAGMATMTAQGVPTAVATTMMRQLFTEASKSGTDLSDAIAAVAGDSLPNLVKQGTPVSEILEMVRASMPDQEFRDLFGSVEASNAALLMTGPNAKAMASNLAEMQGSAGATDAAFETMAATAQFKVQKALNWLRTTVSDLGLRVLPIVVNFVEQKVIPAFQAMATWFTSNRATLLSFWTSFQGAMRRVSNWVKANIVPIVVAAFGAISTWVTENKEGITGFFTAFKTAAKTLVDYFSTSFGLIKTAVQALFDAIGPQNVETGGIGSFFTNIVAWATAAVNWYSEFLSGITDAIQGIIDWINENPDKIQSWFETAQAAVEIAVGAISTVIGGIVTAVQAIATWVQENPDTIQAWFDTAKAVLEVTIGAISTVIGGIVTAVQAIVTWINENPDTIQGWFDTAKAALETTVAAIETVIGNVVTAVQKIVTWVQENPSTIQGWFETAKTALETVVGAIETVIGGVVAAVESITAWVNENPETISGWFDTAKAALETVVAAISTVISGVTDAVAAISAWINENPETISGWFDTAKGAVETSVNAVTTIIGGVVTAITAIKTWIDANQEGITGFFTALKTAAEGVKDFFETSWGLVSTAISQIWNIGADEEGEPAVQTLFNNIITWGQGVVDWFGSEEGGLAISAFFTGIVTWATTAVNWFEENIGRITDSIATITTWLSENPTAIQDWFSTAWAAVDATITTFKTGVGALVTKFGTIATWLTTNATVIQTWFNKAWGVVNTVKENMLQAVTDLTEKWATIEGFFETLWTTVGTTFQDKWALIRDFIITPFVDAVGWLTDNWAGVSQWFVDMWNNVGTAFSEAWQGITDLLFPTPSYAQQVKEVWGGIVDAIRGIFTDGANSAIGILNQLVGLMNTALKKWNELKFEIKGFSTKVPWPSITNPLRKKQVGWGGISITTPNIALVPTLPPFATAATGGIVDSPTLTLAGEGGEPEAIVPLSRASEFGFGGGGKPSVAIYADTINGWDNLRDLLAEAGLDVQLSGASNTFAGI